MLSCGGPGMTTEVAISYADLFVVIRDERVFPV